jgi:hypothetical protein
MQSDIKNIYKITSARTGVDENIYKTIGDFIFKETKSNIEKPKSLIIKLKGIGFWYLRRTKLKESIQSFPPYYDIDGFNQFESEDSHLKFINKQKFYKMVKERLRDYEDYIKLKSDIKQKKDEFNKLPESKKEGNSSCQDKS